LRFVADNDMDAVGHAIINHGEKGRAKEAGYA